MLHVGESCFGLKEAKVSDKRHVLLRMTSTELGGADRLCPPVTIDVLPDNVLLEVFEFYLDKDEADNFDFSHNYDGWQTLVHVCYRWRCIVFASPRRLDLKLYCSGQRSVDSKTLDIWPALPIVIVAENMESKEDVTNVTAAFRDRNRVCKIYYRNEQFRDSFLEEFAAIDEPFPALTSLDLISLGQDVPVLPDSFLGGSAPRLRSLHLAGITYPSIGKLLSSTTNLVQLSLRHIPHSGFISPETIVPHLSMLAKLETLSLGIQYARSRAHRASRHPPPLTRVAFPSLASLELHGDIEYLEDILSQIETPALNKSYLTFFNKLVFDTPLLGHFIRRTKAFMTIHTARVEFSSSDVGVTFSGREETDDNDDGALDVHISCKPLDWQLSALAQVLNSFLSSLPTLESLEIAVMREDWQGEIEVTQWQEFLHPFTSVKEMTLVREGSVRLIAPAIQELSGERATEVLPALQNLFLDTEDWRPSGPVKESIGQFIATRQLYGHPVTVDYRVTGGGKLVPQTGNYVLDQTAADFTFGVQDQQADLMDFTFDPITSPENDDMLAAMQAVQNPTWWRNMMMPGLVVPFSSTSLSSGLTPTVLCSFFWPTEEQSQDHSGTL